MIKYKKILALLLSFIFTIIYGSIAFGSDNATYTVNAISHYKNPETGVVEDKGNGDIALGEAMCQSTLGEKATAEIKDGKKYLTLRLNLVSSIENVKIFTQQQKGGPYSQVKYTVTAENYTEDYAEYRFEVKDFSYYVAFEFYVDPMGRDVRFFASVDTSPIKQAEKKVEQQEIVKVEEKQQETTAQPINQPVQEEPKVEKQQENKVETKETTQQQTTNTTKVENNTNNQNNTKEEKAVSTEKQQPTENLNTTDNNKTSNEFEESKPLDTDEQLNSEVMEENLEDTVEEMQEEAEEIQEVFNQQNQEESKSNNIVFIILGVALIAIVGALFIIKRRK